MADKLSGYINSSYFEAANHMRPKWKQLKVIVYVESYDDIFFWRDVLAKYETDQIGFEIVLPSRTNLSRGKKSAIMNHLGSGLGTSMIACVDADFDYLLQGHTPASKAFLSNEFVVHTYVYAIESYQCYAPTLHEICVMATLNDHKVFDFEEYLRAYSIIIYDLFIWSIWLYRNDLANEFPMAAFCNTTTTHKVNVFNPEDTLEHLRKNVNRKVATLQQEYPQAKGKLNALKDELFHLGVTPENTYLYIQGHHLKDNIVLEVLTPICNNLRRAREKEIKQCAEHAQQMDNELASYQHSQASVEEMLRRNTLYKSAPQFQLLTKHLEAVIAKLTATLPERTNPKPSESKKPNAN